jgi:hypothetical protein
MKLIFVLLVFSFLTVKNIHAYLDPGSGSYMLQLLIGLFLGGAYFFRNFFKNVKDKIVNFFKKIFKKK